MFLENSSISLEVIGDGCKEKEMFELKSSNFAMRIHRITVYYSDIAAPLYHQPFPVALKQSVFNNIGSES